MSALQYILVILIGFAAGAAFTGLEIPVLKKKQFGQYIREEGPKSHLSKQGTPTMGGIAIYAAIIVAALAGCVIGGLHFGHVTVILAAGLLFGLIGFLDDFIKVAAKHNLGLRAWQKLALQILFSVLLGLYVVKCTDQGTDIWIPFLNKDIDFGIFYIPFVAFVMVAMTNSVNLTDGLDGLCSSVTAVVAVFFLIVSAAFPGFGESAVSCAAIAGACLGFLVFNHHPAKIFMGDTGSMALGGVLTAAVVMTKMEFLIPVAGFIYVLEALSVIIQVLYFKKTGGKRIFRMAPIHHHFELSGYHETKIVICFWITTAILVLISLLSLPLM